MKAYNILLLLCWIEFMGTALSGTEPTVAISTTAFTTDEHASLDPGDGSSSDDVSVSMTVNSVQPTVAQRDESTVLSTIPISELATSATSNEPIRDTSEVPSGIPHTDTSTTTPLSHASSSALPSAHTQPAPSRPADDCLFARRTGLIMVMVTGGLILACTILLLTTVLLAWKLCQVRRHDQGSDADLISNSDYWMGTAQRNRRRSETGGVETGVLMSPLSQEQVKSGSTAKEPETGKLDVKVIQELEAARNKKKAAATPDGDSMVEWSMAAGGMEEQTSGAGNSSSSKKTVDAAHPPTATTDTVVSSHSENETTSAAVVEV